MALPGLLARKFGMSRILADDGSVTPVTMLIVDPQKVVRVDAERGRVLLGAGKIRERKNRKNRWQRELSLPEGFDKKAGEELSLKDLPEGEKVTLTGVSKGKGFAGVIKRWNFGGGRATHGSNLHRSTGSIGQCWKPGEVQKGKKMPGRLGGKTVTLKNCEIVKVLPEEGAILVRGAIPGARDSLVIVRCQNSSTKK